MIRFLRILILLFILFPSFSCVKYDQKVEIKDLQKTQFIKLNKRSDQGLIIGMRIRGSGRLDGEAEIVLMLNGKPYKTEKMKGNIKFTWGGDWYADSITLIYRPLNVESGILILEYWFNDIKEKTANRHVHRIASKSGPR